MFYDDIDEYKCPICGHGNETCFCDDDMDYDLGEGYPYEEYFEIDYIHDAMEEIVCYMDGKPLTRYDIENMDNCK